MAEVDQVKKMIGRVIDKLGGIYILVNNAGVSLEIVSTVEQSLQKWDRMMSINERVNYLCCKESRKVDDSS